MIRIDENFVFEQIGDNHFHLIRETYPTYARDTKINLHATSKAVSDCIHSAFIDVESAELFYASKHYGRDNFVEVMDGTCAEHKILYAVKHDVIEWLSRASEQEQLEYFGKLYIAHECGVGIFAKEKAQ